MSTINSTMAGAMQSPRTQMDQRISAAVQTGAISTTDQAALGTALDAIDSSLAAERTGGSKPSGDMKGRIDGLIQQQVESGALTEDQATELQSFFAQGPEGGAQGKGPGGPGGPGGPPPAPPSGEASEETDATDSVSDTASTKLEALEAFLERLRASQSSATGYGAASQTSSATGLVLDSLA
jgi:hypothetical protein